MRAWPHNGSKGQFLVKIWAFPAMMLAFPVMMLASLVIAVLAVQDLKGRRRGMDKFRVLIEIPCVKACGDFRWEGQVGTGHHHRFTQGSFWVTIVERRGIVVRLARNANVCRRLSSFQGIE